MMMTQNRTVCLVTLLAIAAGAGRLTAGEAPGATGDQRPLRLAFITCSVEAKFFEPVKKGMQDAGRLMNAQCDFFGTEGVDLEAQAAMVRKAAADGYDGIAVNLVDQEAFDDVVEQTIGQGVPVVGFNTDDFGTPNARLSCVNQQLEAAGRKLAQHVLSQVPAGSHVLMTMHDAGISSLEDRLRGLQSVLEGKNVRWTELIAGNDSIQGTETIAEALRKHPDIRIVLNTGQADTEAAGRAIKKYFRGKGYWSAGFDLSPTTLQLIKEGMIRCTVDQQPYIQGFYPVVQLAQRVRYGIMPSDIDAGATIIDRSSVDRVIELTERKYR